MRKIARQVEHGKFEASFDWHWKQLAGAPKLARQSMLVPDRQFRFDFSHADAMVAVELDGGLFMNGGHSRGVAVESQYEKCNAAAALGWCVLKFGTKRLTSEMHLVVEEVLAVIQTRLGVRQ